MIARRPLIAGNWKMNARRDDGLALAGDLARRMEAAGEASFDMLICPPATLLGGLGAEIEGSGLALGGQDCHAAESGAHTGDLSAAMLADIGCEYVIVGHSERRANHGEDDAMVAAKAAAGLKAGLTAIICVGETEAERDSGAAGAVIARQLAGSLPPGDGENIVIAYEPVWAIGTGRTPGTGDVAEIHALIRAEMAARLGAAGAGRLRVIYGGSVKPGNAAELLALDDVDGALVGGASLDADDFWAIATAAG